MNNTVELKKEVYQKFHKLGFKYFNSIDKAVYRNEDVERIAKNNNISKNEFLENNKYIIDIETLII